MASKRPLAVMTEILHKTMKAVGCDPVVCHACGQPMDVGSDLGHNQGLFVHHGACEDVAEADMVAPLSEETREAVRKAFKDLADVALRIAAQEDKNAMESLGTAVDRGWSSGITTHGPAPIELFRQAGLLQTECESERAARRRRPRGLGGKLPVFDDPA